MVESFMERVESGGHVVDMGCGIGVPFDRILVENGYEVNGVDIAEENIKAAQNNLPDARFVQSDFTEFEPDSQFDGLLCLFALFHIPRDEHAETLDQFHSILADGAPILITMGTTDVERMTEEFYGEDMVWSFYDADRNRELVAEAGFDVHRAEHIPDSLDGSEHLWVLGTA